MICHRVAVNPKIREEWAVHQSRVADGWRRAMYARRKFVELAVREDLALRNRLVAQMADTRQEEAMLKDYHLVEAALQADGIVVSLDDTARRLFQIRELNTITWVNPVSEHLRVQSWLEQGAPPVDEWRLGYGA